MSKKKKQDLSNLSREEKLELLDELLVSLAKEKPEELYLTKEYKEELDRRFEKAEKGETPLLTLEDIRTKYLRKK